MIEALLRTVRAIEDRLDRLERHSRGGRWVDWTPTLAQSGAVAATVTEAKYCLIGKVCHIYARLAVTGAGTGNNTIVIGGIPAACSLAYSAGAETFPVGVGIVVDTGSARRVGAVCPIDANDLFIQWYDGAYIGSGSANFALANGDFVGFTASWRVL